MVRLQVDGLEEESGRTAVALQVVLAPGVGRDGAGGHDFGFEGGGGAFRPPGVVAEDGAGEGDLAAVEAGLLGLDLGDDEHAAGVGFLGQVAGEQPVEAAAAQAQGQVVVEELRLVGREQ